MKSRIEKELKYSNELQFGKAGEHLVCADLILQGYGAHLTDLNSPFDIVLESKGKLFKVQVKTTKKTINYPKSKNVYRFGLRKGKGVNRIIDCDVDFFAFVAMDIKKIAYLHSSELMTKEKKIKMCVEFRSKIHKYHPKYRLTKNIGKYIEDYEKINIRKWSA